MKCESVRTPGLAVIAAVVGLAAFGEHRPGAPGDGLLETTFDPQSRVQPAGDGMTGVQSRSQPTWFYVGAALLGLVVALAGFSRTFFMPLGAGEFQAPAVVFVHAGAAFSWVLLFVLQPGLIRLGRYDVHVRTGAIGAVLAVVVAVTAVPVALYAVERDLTAGLDFAVSTLPGVFTSMALFLALVIAGVLNRHRPQTHKRLMLLATIVVLWPAWFRLRHWFPGVPRPEIWLAVVAADALIIVAMIRDKLVEERVHPVWWFVGLPVIAEQAAEALLFDTPPWRAVSRVIYGLFS